MKTRFTLSAIIIIQCFFLNALQAQNQAVGRFMRTGPDNAKVLLSAYFNPLFESVSPSLNTGWYNTADAHRFGEFDIRIVANAVPIPSEAQYFDVAALGLREIAVVEGDRTATFFGASGSEAWQEVIYQPEGATFDRQPIALADGSGLDFAPNSSIQINVGLPKYTELMVRFVPRISAGDVKLGSWGIGLKHEITESIPRINLLPFDLSLGFAYSRLNADLDLLLFPETDPFTGLPYPQSNPSQVPTYDNQNAQFRSDAFNLALIASKTFKVIAFYGGIRYDYARTQANLLGDYPVTNAEFLVENYRDPIQIEKAHEQVGLNLGTELRLGIFTFAIDATLSDKRYNSFNLSLGFGRYGINY